MESTETATMLESICDETVADVVRAGRHGGCDGLIGFVEAFALEHRRIGKTTWEFALVLDGPGIWLQVTPKRATILGSWGTARVERPVPLPQQKLALFVDVLNENEAASRA